MNTRNLFWNCMSLVVVLCLIVLLFSDRWTPIGNFFWSDLNLYGIVAFVLALFSLLYTFLAYKSQSQTEENTRNVPIADQKKKLRDFKRHEYRNLVVALSTAVKYFDSDNYKNGIRLSYPSESHILKLQAAPEDFVLDISSEMAATVSEMRLLIRNYNIEINVACNHLLKQHINKEAIASDYDNLVFKPLFLVKNACEMEAKLNGCKEEGFRKDLADLIQRSIGIIVDEHLKKLAKSSLKNLTDLVKNEGRLDYFDPLEMGNGLTIESANQHSPSSALQRSFCYMLGTDKKSLPWQMNFNDDDEIKSSDISDYIDAIINVLSELDSIKPGHFQWIAAYKDGLKRIQAGQELDFVQFFPLMLKLDIAAELDKIGMVNF